MELSLAIMVKCQLECYTPRHVKIRCCSSISSTIRTPVIGVMTGLGHNRCDLALRASRHGLVLGTYIKILPRARPDNESLFDKLLIKIISNN